MALTFLSLTLNSSCRMMKNSFAEKINNHTKMKTEMTIRVYERINLQLPYIFVHKPKTLKPT